MIYTHLYGSPFQRIDSQEARRRAKYLERENSRLGTEVKDLGKQVTILVMQVEAARAGQPPPVIPGKKRVQNFEVNFNLPLGICHSNNCLFL